MSPLYVDTSAVAKRYLVETGSAWIRTWIEPAAGNVIVVSDLTPVEMVSLLHRRQREGSLSAQSADSLEADFLVHLTIEYLVAPVDAAVLLQARALAKKHSLRALDAIQLACANGTVVALGQSLTFVSADRDLLLAAAAEGFRVEDPNAHP